jgi:hypothetical protein
VPNAGAGIGVGALVELPAVAFLICVAAVLHDVSSAPKRGVCSVLCSVLSAASQIVFVALTSHDETHTQGMGCPAAHCSKPCYWRGCIIIATDETLRNGTQAGNTAG